MSIMGTEEEWERLAEWNNVDSTHRKVQYRDLPSEVRNPNPYGGSSEDAHRTADFINGLFARMIKAGWSIIPPQCKHKFRLMNTENDKNVYQCELCYERVQEL